MFIFLTSQNIYIQISAITITSNHYNSESISITIKQQSVCFNSKSVHHSNHNRLNLTLIHWKKQRWNEDIWMFASNHVDVTDDNGENLIFFRQILITLFVISCLIFLQFYLCFMRSFFILFCIIYFCKNYHITFW